MSDLIERPDRLALTRFADLVNRAPAPWLIKGVIRESSVAMLYGRRGSYKSFVALSMAGAVATGVPWLGHPVTQSGLVIYIAAEGGGGMVQRSRALSAQLDVPPSQINMRFITEPMICLPDSDDMELVIERIREAIDWEPAGYVDRETGHVSDEPLAREWPRMIVVDTLARCFIGDENKQEFMNAFIQGIDRLKIEFNCTILIVHHTGINETRPRGSTVHESACDTVYALEAGDGADTSLLLDCKKMKDSKEPDVFEMERLEVHVERRACDDPDEDLTSVVIQQPSGGDATERQGALLSILDERGPMTWAAWHVSSNLPKTSFHRGWVELRDLGLIVKENGLWRPS